MSLASFHYAFESRDELMAELVAYVVEEQERAIQPALAVAGGGITMRDAIRAGLQNYLEVVRENPLREKAMFELTHYAMRSPGLEATAKRQYAAYYSLAERTLQAAADRARMTWALPTGEIATLLVALTDGLTLSWLVNRDDAAAARIMDFAADSLAGLARSHHIQRTA